jgi:hypothetical protein
MFRAGFFQLFHENRRTNMVKLLVIYLKRFIVNVIIIYKKIHRITVTCFDDVYKNVLYLRTKSK